MKKRAIEIITGINLDIHCCDELFKTKWKFASKKCTKNIMDHR